MTYIQRKRSRKRNKGKNNNQLGQFGNEDSRNRPIDDAGISDI